MNSMPSSCNTRSGSAMEKCRLEGYDCGDDFDVRPPSGTSHQQPGKHLSIDTRFIELSLENSSLFAESEKEPPALRRSAKCGTLSRRKTMPNIVQVPKGNVYVTSPFKQGPERNTKGPILVIDPSHDLKQQTMASVAKMKKQVERENRTRYTRLHYSQVQRGSLKTLGRPMTASGPGIRSCQGIVAGLRTSHGFARRHTENSFIENGRFSHLATCVCSSTKPYESCPGSSFRRTSYASSLDRVNDVSDGGFSEDENDDSIDIRSDVNDLQDHDKIGPSGEDLGDKEIRRNEQDLRPEEDPRNVVDHPREEIPRKFQN